MLWSSGSCWTRLLFQAVNLLQKCTYMHENVYAAFATCIYIAHVYNYCTLVSPSKVLCCCSHHAESLIFFLKDGQLLNSG